MSLLSLKNPYYEFSQIGNDIDIAKYQNNISTFYVVDGSLEFNIDNKKIAINPNEGLLVSANSKIQDIKKYHNTIAFEVVSKKSKNDLIELVDKENIISEEVISNLRF